MSIDTTGKIYTEINISPLYQTVSYITPLYQTLLPVFDRDRFISVKDGLLKQIPVEALVETGMLQLTTRD